MVVDDHAAFRRQATRLLDAAGFDVVGWAVTCDGAVEAVERLRPEVVLLDVCLPDGSGAALAPQLGAGGASVLLTSARSAEDLGGLITGLAFVAKADLGLAAIFRELGHG